MLIIQGYQVGEKIFTSVNSVVYRGQRLVDGQLVILKILNNDYPPPEHLARYRQEYEITRKLEHEGVVRVLELLEIQHSLALVLENFGGISLHEWYATFLADNPDPLRVFLTVFFPVAIRIAEILSHIHQANVIHKDINPSNILINPKTQEVKLIDFGISTALSRENPTLVNPGVLEGTLGYISPEQTGRMNRSLDYRTDFYSLGATFYELLTGQLPFPTDDCLELVHAHIARSPQFPEVFQKTIPEVLQAIVLKLMAKNAEDRYQSAWGLREDLQRCWEAWQEKGEIPQFPLGSEDLCDRFIIPQKLYGRKSEVRSLLQAFDRIRNGQSELLLVAGYSGMGKSVLVAEVHKPITAARGYFIAGKFDQFQRNIPYSAVVQAFGSLMRQLLGETAEQLEQWRVKLLDALGPNGQAIVDVIPEVEQIIGPQPPLTELGPGESQNRFNRTFQNFIQVFCSPEHPLVLFLDDLQWADSATLKLISVLMTQNSTGYLLLIGAYRDNEVSPSHPLMMMLESVSYQQLELQPLTLALITQLISDTLHQPETTVQSLADLIMAKTGGNPFFVNELLKTLYTEGWLQFDRGERAWVWDTEAIANKEITDNVVDLMLSKLHKQSPHTQQVLSLAACIGAEFDLQTLAMIGDREPSAVFADLKTAIDSDLIIPLSGVDERLLIQRHRFGHDRIQQAAYSLIPAEEKPVLHWRIGQLLPAIGTRIGIATPGSGSPLQGDTLAEQLFTVVDHLNLGRALAETPEEIDRLIRLNLLAGQRAIAATAYEAALMYLKIALEMLPPDSWQTDYELTRDIYFCAIEAEYVNSQYDAALSRAAFLVGANGHSPVKTFSPDPLLDRLRVYELTIQLYTAQNQPLKAVDTGIEALEEAKVDLTFATDSMIKLPGVNEISESLGQNFSQQSQTIEMTDQAQLATMRILMAICSAAYFAKPTVLQNIILTMVHLTLTQGYSPLAAYAYVWYAALSSAGGEIDRGYHAGSLAIALVEHYHARELRAKVNNLHSVLVRHWKEPARNNIPPLQAGIQSGLETGDNEYTSYCLKDYCVLMFLTGHPLEEVETKMAQSEDLLRKLDQEYSIVQTNIWRQVGLNFLGRSPNPAILQGDIFDAAAVMPHLRETNNQTLIFIVDLARLILAYSFGDYQAAKEYAIAANECRAAVMGFLYGPLHNFYSCLTLLALAQAQGQLSEADLATITEYQTQMQHWASHCPENFQHKYDLVAAELASVQGGGDLWQIAELYEQAIAGARAQKYLQEEALAWERAAYFYLCHHREAIAETYLAKADYCYGRWQAHAKVRSLQQEDRASTITKTITTTKSTTTIGESLDLMSIVRASQAITTEIKLDRLLSLLMETLIQNAGAQFGYLLLETDGQWCIEAFGKIDSEQVEVAQGRPFTDKDGICPAIVQYAIRTRETVVLHDAAQEGDFVRDRYIQTRQPKSVLCAPLLKQGQTIGIIYLENNLVVGAFSRDRLETIKIFSTQAAISIENARFYSRLEDYNRNLEVKVELRTQELRQKNQSLQRLQKELQERNVQLQIEQEKSERLLQNMLPLAIAEQLKQGQTTISQRFDSVTVLFSDIVGFTQLSGRIDPRELVDMLNEILSGFDELAAKFEVEKIKTIGDAYMVVGGLPIPRPDSVEAIALMALEMQKTIAQFKDDRGHPLMLRIGISTGPVVAGVIGLKKPAYDLWGDTVNIASRMESHGVPGCIQVCHKTYTLLYPLYEFEPRGAIKIKGKGEMPTYLLKGKKISNY